MSDEERIKSLMKEAEVYQKHGLLEESKEKYEEILNFIQNHERYSGDTELIDEVTNKIRTAEERLDEINQVNRTPELSQEVQALISRLFSFSADKGKAEVEGAVMLAKFGQYEKAIEEFQSLIARGIMPLLSAKNILMCHLFLSAPDAAVAQFKQWVSQAEFSRKQLQYMRAFLGDAFVKQGIKADLPQVDEAPLEDAQSGGQVVDIIDISSFMVRLEDGPRKGETVDFEVTFQLGNKISTIIPARQKDLADAFKPGLRLSEIQCFSSMAAFIGKGIVSKFKRITSGPRQGDYSLDITIDSV
jgi:tetratricopeptide (TPR) repeat protein